MLGCQFAMVEDEMQCKKGSEMVEGDGEGVWPATPFIGAKFDFF